MVLFMIDKLNFFREQQQNLLAYDKLIKKKNFKSSNFEIRFHLEPNIKIMKTQDGKSIFIELE